MSDSADEPDWINNVEDTSPSPKKTAISIRLDPHVFAFFKAGGRGYQTRINAVLRAYMNSRRRQSEGA